MFSHSQILHIINDFQTEYRRKPQGEISAFDALAKSLYDNARSKISAKETHGTKHLVEITNRPAWWGHLRRNLSSSKVPVSCEISDLLTIWYSVVNQEIRICHLQAKFERSGTAWCKTKFKGDYIQWHLLSQKPFVSGVRGHRVPHDLFHSSIAETMGAFGIFYPTTTGELEFVFSAASLTSINIPNPVQDFVTGRTIYIDPTITAHAVLNCAHFREAVRTPDIYCYLHYLLNGTIGEPLSQCSLSRQGILSAYLSRCLQSFENDQNIQSLKELLRRFDPEPESFSTAIFPKRVIVINGDSEN